MNKLEELVYVLATSKVKKITPKMIAAEAERLGVKIGKAKRAWKNYSQLDIKNDRFSKRFKTGSYVGLLTDETRAYAKNWQKTKLPQSCRRVYFKTAAKVILEVKNTPAKVYEVLTKYDVSRAQYYKWLEELTITGKLLNHKIFDWTKFPKKDVKEIIKFTKHPERFITYTVLAAAQLERLGTVMDEYLK